MRCNTADLVWARGLRCADTKPSKCVLEVEKIKRRRQERRAAQVAAREQPPEAGCISDALLPGYGYDVMIASVDLYAVVSSARCNIYSLHLALMLRCQCPSVCDGSALAHYS